MPNCTCSGVPYQALDQFALESAVLPDFVTASNEAALDCREHGDRANATRRRLLHRARRMPPPDGLPA